MPRRCANTAFTSRAGTQPTARLLRAQAAWAERLSELWEAEGYSAPVGLSLTLNARFRSRLARITPPTRTFELRRDAPRWSRRRLHHVIVHELAHAAVYTRHGAQARPHGREWRRLMALAGVPAETRCPAFCPDGGAPPTATRAVRRDGTGVRRLLFAHRCPVCQMVRYSARRVTRWKCRACVEAGLDGTLLIRPEE